MRILLQFPEGLKQQAVSYIEKYTKQGHQVFLSASPCYGACDLALEEAKAINADKIIHFGHARFVKEKLPIEVEYIEYHIDGDLEKFKKTAEKIKEKNIALVTTVQYIPQLKQLKEVLESLGKHVYVGKGVKAEHVGQVIGCDYTAAGKETDSEIILYFGDGLFHPLVMDDRRPVYIIHPKSGELKNMDKELEKRRKRRKGMLTKAFECTSFGIIVSTKTGQYNLQSAEWAKKELEKRKKSAYILISNEVSPLSLNNFLLFDCYITVACPRLSDDSEEFGKPILDMQLLNEFLKMFDEA